MREIKFRAWDKQFNEMASIICLNIGDYSEDHILKTKSRPYTYNQQFHNITLMQFTGLKDKNGKEIYEGDILKINGFYDGLYNTLEVRWIKNGFKCVGLINEKAVCETVYDYGFHEEIIGNIYENPELLEG